MASLLRNILKRRVGPENGKDAIRRLYRREDYLDAYSRHTDLRVDDDPHEAIGGHWDEMGELQFRFLRDDGLEPRHSLLDIGCGTLRGGRHFIRYLDAGRYTGLEISEKALAYAERLVADEALGDKRPTLLLNQEKRLRFSALAGATFDYLLAQSVFTHLPTEYIEECFACLDRVMTEKSRFCFTFFSDDDHRRRALKDFSQPWSFYRDLAARHDYVIEDRSQAYPHPSGQNMVVLSRA